MHMSAKRMGKLCETNEHFHYETKHGAKPKTLDQHGTYTGQDNTQLTINIEVIQIFIEQNMNNKQI